MKIRTKLALAILIATVVLAGVVFVGLELFKEQTTSQVHDNVNQTALQTAQQVDAIVREHAETVKFYASKPAATDPNRSTAHLNLFVNSTAFYAAQRISENGTVTDYQGQVTAEARNQFIGTDLSEDQVYSRIQRGNRSLYISDAAYAEAFDRYFISISVPVFDENGRFDGVLAGAVRLQQGDFFMAARPLQTDSQTVTISTTVDGQRRTLFEPNQQFDSAIEESATVDSSGWTVTVAADSGPLQTRLRNLALAQGLGLFVVISVVVGLGFWEYSMNLKQTERLLAGFDKLRDGEYDYSLSLTAAEEWEQISQGYNDLSAGIKERERAIREREQRLGVLNRVLRHNLQNDMSVILTYAEMLPEFSDSPEVEEASEKIYEMGSGLIRHGKKARQIETAMESAEEGTTLVEVVPLVEDIVAEYREEYADVRFETDLPEQAAAEAISSFGFAIENIVENAAHHNDAEEPSVEVSVTETDDTVSIAVADNGPGVPSHEQEVLTQGEETALEHGSGVGLWLSYWVVDKSDGELSFDENAPRGAIVTVEVAAYDTDRPPADRAAVTAEASDD